MKKNIRVSDVPTILEWISDHAWGLILAITAMGCLVAGFKVNSLLNEAYSPRKVAIMALYNRAIQARNEAVFASSPEKYSAIGAGEDPIRAQIKADEAYIALKMRVISLPEGETAPYVVLEFLENGPGKFIVVDNVEPQR